MISSDLRVEWRPRPFFHMEAPTMASGFQPRNLLSQDCTAFRPTPKPENQRPALSRLSGRACA